MSSSTIASASASANVLAFPRLGVAVDHPCRTLLALVLAFTIALTGCWFNPAWVTDALNDLPVLIQMAEAIVQIISLTQNGTSASSTEIAAINQISSVGTQGLLAIQALYKSYTSANSSTTIADIKAAGAALTANLQQLLGAAQIKNPALLARVTAAVNLIISTVNTFIGLLPASSAAKDLKMARAAAKTATIPKASDLRQQWLSAEGFALAK